MRTKKDYLIIYLKGIAMGAADIVPGVSGGTIAFISGIYEELINSIAAFKPELLKTLFKEGFVAVWQKVNGNFLATLIAGIMTSILLFAQLIRHLLDSQPLFVWSFFFGLVLASVFILFNNIHRWRGQEMVALLTGIFLSGVVYFLPTTTAANITPSYIFFCAALAICAMILPGISGSYVLVLLGVYRFMLDALHCFDFNIIAIFIGGAVIGLLCFAHFLKFLLNNYRNPALALLTGFVAGSLVKIWPWSLLPEDSCFLAHYFYPILLIITGGTLVILIETSGRRSAKNK